MNSFTTDKLSAEQKADLLNQLLQEAPVGREIDLSKPIVGRYKFQEYDKMLYHHTTGHVLVVHDAREEAAAAKRGYVTDPSPDHDYSKLSGSNHAAVKTSAPRAQEPLTAAQLAAIDEQEAQGTQGEATPELAADEEVGLPVQEQAGDDRAERRRNRNR